MAGRGWEALPEVQERLGGPPGGSGGVGRPSRRSGSGRRASRWFRRPSWRSDRVQDVLPKILEGSGVPPKVLENLVGPLGGAEGVEGPSRSSLMAR